VVQKPVSREELYASLVDLNLFPRQTSETLTVLIVDDDPRAVDLIATRMAGMASTVLRAYGGREAIEIAKRQVPDLVILDLLMPEVSGFDVVDALMRDPSTAAIPILVVTAAELNAGERERLNGSVAAIVAKTAFDDDRVTAEVRRAMSGREQVS
jgi:CheY-like chemotaxis protein